MTYELLPALSAFALVSSITPGPNNLMLMTSGANFGFRRTLPHMMGVGLGFVGMIVVLGLGLSGIFQQVPVAQTVLKVISVVYMLWLAWKIAHAAPPKPGAEVGKPFTFLQAAAFQWVNPKAWAMGLGAIALYAPDRSVASIILIALVFGAINIPSISLWTAAGQQLRHWLVKPSRLRAFNWTMAALLVLSLVEVVAF